MTTMSEERLLSLPSTMGIRVVAVLLSFWTLVWVSATLLTYGVRPQIVLPLALVGGAVLPLVVEYRWRRDAVKYAHEAMKANVSEAFFGWQGAVKRAMDLAIAMFALIFLAPLLLLIALAILVEDGFPIFYVEERMGRGMQRFRRLKFRSMHRIAAEKLSVGAAWAAQDDVRRTKVGRFIRAWSWDELPALWNVVRGDMSIIGPAAERAEFVDSHREQLWTLATFFVRPGLAMLGSLAARNSYAAQTPSAARESFSSLQYVQTWNLWVDVKALLLLLMNLFAYENEPPKDGQASALDRIRDIMTRPT